MMIDFSQENRIVGFPQLFIFSGGFDIITIVYVASCRVVITEQQVGVVITEQQVGVVITEPRVEVDLAP